MNRRTFLQSGLALTLTALAACSTRRRDPTSENTSEDADAQQSLPTPVASPTPLPDSAAVGPLSAQGSKIVDSTGREVLLTGVNWFGFETGTHAPHGLWYRSWESMLDQIVALGFNTIRLPYSNAIFRPDAKVDGVDYDLNPDLEGLSPLEIMDNVVAGAGQRGLKILLDRHRPDAEAQSKLWYTDRVSEEQWIADWVKLAERYRANDTIIGADLHNEPSGPATWGSGIRETDWRMAAERAGNAMLDVNPDWLIVVEGIETVGNDRYWYGGNLRLADEFPVELKVPNKLVYSVHDYGPGVWEQPWFKAPDFPASLDAKWDQEWGYLVKEGIAPIIVGEFGGRSVGHDIEGTWQRKLLEYLKANRISYTYWCFNPNSSDTGGILQDDWASVYEYKVRLLEQYQFPLLGKAIIRPKPGADRPKPFIVLGTGELRVGYKPGKPLPSTSTPEIDLRIWNDGKQPLNLTDLELRYWLKLAHQPPTVQVEAASFGADAVLTKLVESPIAGQTHYLQITFGRGVVPAQQAADLTLKLLISDGAEHDQTNDYSYGPWKFLKDWDKVGLYHQGKLVWGLPPGT